MKKRAYKIYNPGVVRRRKKIFFAFLLRIIKQRPLLVFFLLLGLMLLSIILGNFVNKPKTESISKPQPKKVTVFRIGSTPKITFSGQIEKSGIAQIVAQASGVVQNINVWEGDTVNKNQTILVLSSNYQGGNALFLAKLIAEKQFQLNEETYPLQKDSLNKQKEIAKLNQDNFQNLKDITGKSIEDTKTLISLNNEIIESLNSNIVSLESSTDSTSSASLILSSKQLKSQFQSANMQLNTSLHSSQYQSDGNNPPSHISIKQFDLTLNQLNLQEKSLELNREITKLQLQLARINESFMYPVSPFNGTVERVFVKPGQFVTPGTILATINGSSKKHLKLIVNVPKQHAAKISLFEPSTLQLEEKKILLYPTYISNTANSFGAHQVFFDISEEHEKLLDDNEFVSVQIPLGQADSISSMPFLPLEAIYQTQNEAYILVVNNNKAQTKKIDLGQVFGAYVQIENGLKNNDLVILNRNVFANDDVEIEK